MRAGRNASCAAFGGLETGPTDEKRPEIYELFAGYALPFEADEDEAVWRDR